MPNFYVVRAAPKRMWSSKKGLEVSTLDNGFFLIDFKDFDDSQRILEEGPRYVGGQPLVLKRWADNLFLQKEDWKSVPIKVTFPNLMCSCRTVNGLSKQAGCIGNPICMDKQIAMGRKLAFARVLVEVSISSNLPDNLTIACRGSTFVQEGKIPLEARGLQLL